ncbi:hypothetical protein ABZ917_29360 [Nonomuraea wenchangensis]
MVQPNPLHDDPALRDLYAAALTRTLHDPEIRDAFDYVTVKPLHIRLEMMEQAAEVFAAVPTPVQEARAEASPRRTVPLSPRPLILTGLGLLVLGVVTADWRVPVVFGLVIGLAVPSYAVLARARVWARTLDRLRSFPYSPAQVQLVRGRRTVSSRRRSASGSTPAGTAWTPPSAWWPARG